MRKAGRLRNMWFKNVLEKLFSLVQCTASSVCCCERFCRLEQEHGDCLLFWSLLLVIRAYNEYGYREEVRQHLRESRTLQTPYESDMFINHELGWKVESSENSETVQQVLSDCSLDCQWLGSIAGGLLHEGMREGIVLLSWRIISRKMFIFIMGLLWWSGIWASSMKGTELADTETYSFLCCPTAAFPRHPA